MLLWVAENVNSSGLSKKRVIRNLKVDNLRLAKWFLNAVSDLSLLSLQYEPHPHSHKITAGAPAITSKFQK